MYRMLSSWGPGCWGHLQELEQDGGHQCDLCCGAWLWHCITISAISLLALALGRCSAGWTRGSCSRVPAAITESPEGQWCPVPFVDYSPRKEDGDISLHLPDSRQSKGLSKGLNYHSCIPATLTGLWESWETAPVFPSHFRWSTLSCHGLAVVPGNFHKKATLSPPAAWARATGGCSLAARPSPQGWVQDRTSCPAQTLPPGWFRN